MIEVPVSKRGPFAFWRDLGGGRFQGDLSAGQPEGHPPTGPALRADGHEMPGGGGLLPQKTTQPVRDFRSLRFRVQSQLCGFQYLLRKPLGITQDNSFGAQIKHASRFKTVIAV